MARILERSDSGASLDRQVSQVEGRSGWLDLLAAEFQFGIRVLWKSPVFTLVAVCMLAVGIGASAAIFSVVNAVLLQPLPFPEPERLVMLWERNIELGFDKEQVAPANVESWLEQSNCFEHIGFMTNDSPGTRNFILKTGDQFQRVRGRYASSSLPRVLGVGVALGRTMQASEDRKGGAQVAVVSYSFWQRHFGGDSGAIGKTVTLQMGSRDQIYTVVGVMPRDFRLPADVDMWLSLSGHPFYSPTRYVHDLWVFAKLKPGVSVAAAEEQLGVIQARIYQEHPEVKQLGSSVVVVPLLEQVIGPQTKPILLVVFASVGFVLLITCVNVANLLLVRAAARQKEMGIRMALGSSRAGIVRQLFVESVILAVVGGALGVFLAFVGIGLLPALDFGGGLGVKDFRINRLDELHMDGNVLLFACGVSILTTLVFGLLPALLTSRLDINRTLKEEGRGASGGLGRQRFLTGLLVAEVALALTLLVGAGLMVRSFINMQLVDPGLNPENVLKAEIDLAVASREFSGSIQDVTRRIAERAVAIPGVEAVGAVGEIPLVKSGYPCNLHVEGRQMPGNRQLPIVDVRICTPGLFRALRIPVQSGRDFDEQIDHEKAPATVVVNEMFVRKFFPSESPLGKYILVGHPVFPLRPEQHRKQIVGVVGNVRNFGLTSKVNPEVYVCYRQHGWGGAEIGPAMLFRTTNDPRMTIAALRHEIEGEKYKGRIILNPITIERTLGDSVARERFATWLMVAFALTSLALAAMGMYGVMSYSVSQRTSEIGIRMALGAQPRDVLQLVLGGGMKLTLIGVIIGIAASYAGALLMRGMLFEVSPFDAVVYSGVTVVLLFVAVLACYLPTRRAMNVNPLEALRHE